MGWIFSKPQTLGSGNQEDQTRFLFHRCVYDLTRDSESRLDSEHDETALGHRASEEMSRMESPCTMFDTDMETLNKVVNCLKKHVKNMKDDTELQEELRKLMLNFSKDTLWEWCRLIFADTCDVWDAIFTLFALGVQLCFQVVLDHYDVIVETISAAVTVWAGGWLLSNGGWVALVAGGGMFAAIMMILLFWIGWLMPSTGSTRKGGASAPKGGASAPKGGASAPKGGASAPKGGASAPKVGIKLD